MNLLIFKYLHKAFYSRLVNAGGILLIGSVIVGLLGYVFQVLLGRMLSVSDYGIYNALMALAVLLSAPLGTLSMLVTRKVSSFKAHLKFDYISSYFFNLSIRSLIITGAIFLVILFFSDQIGMYLNLSNKVLIYMTFLFLFFLFPFTINNAFLLGLQKYKWINWVAIIEIIIKIMLVLLLIWIGYDLTGALAGTILALIIGTLVSYIVLSTFFKKNKNTNFKTESLEIKEIFPVLIANIAFIAMTQIDLLVVNYYFSSFELGLYAAIAIFGKSILYLPMAISKALFPLVAEDYSKGNSSLNDLNHSILITLIMTSFGVLFFFIFGEKLIVILLGQNYDGTGMLLGCYALAMVPLALIQIFEHFLIAQGRVIFAYIFLSFVPFELFFIYFFHDTLLMVIMGIGISSLLVMLFGLKFLLEGLR